jgi:hypothetical protein
MGNIITLSIPAHWLQELGIKEDELRQALMLGLAQLRQQQMTQDVPDRTVQILLSTGRIHRLSATLAEDKEPYAKRQAPPALPGPPASEILIAQRRGEL